MTKIREVSARKIYDSRGEPTVEVQLTTTSGIQSTASVPTGVSSGSREAKNAGGDHPSRHTSTDQAIQNIETRISQKLIGFDILNQKELDQKMIDLDGTQDKSNLGANAILPVSLAAAKASALTQEMPLWKYIQTLSKHSQDFPTPLFNFIEGGKHADNPLTFQEFLVIPNRKTPFPKALETITNLYALLKKTLASKNFTTLTADEGGFAPHLTSNKEALALLKSVIEESGNAFPHDTSLGIDAAASSFFESGTYNVPEISPHTQSSEIAEYYNTLCKEFYLQYIEDPMSETDLEGWKTVFKVLGEKTQVVGDDLTTTNLGFVEKSFDSQMINGVIIKPNQIGTLTEVLNVADFARRNNLKTTVSHRAGETEDTAIADIAVGIGAYQVKFGAPARERIPKYNRLLKIFTTELNTE